jgi:hypothetical protein
MSLENHDFPVRQEDDWVWAGRIMAVAVAAIVIGAAGVFFAGALLFATVGTLRPNAAGPEGPKRASRTLSQIEQTPVMVTRTGIDMRDSQRRELETWGWVDHNSGVAKIPIERAIDVVIAEAAR